MMARMGEFFDFLSTALGAPTPKLFIVFGLLFLGVAVVGSITGRIQPGPVGRLLGAVLGPVLIVTGLTMEMRPLAITPARAAQVASTPQPTPAPTSVKSATVKATPVPTSRPTPDARVFATAVARRQSSFDELRSIQEEYDQKALDLINR
jgi:hypothetical protein